MVGDGVFETMQVVRGEAFTLTRHLRRLRTSAAGMEIDCPADDTVRTAVAAVLEANPDAGRLRITVSSGSGPLGSQRGDNPPTLVVAAGAAASWPPHGSVRVMPWTRNEGGATAGLKTTSYAENVLSLRRANQHGDSEAIFANTRGELCEGTGTNVFVERDGQLLTPPLSSGCLAGITRELVLELVDVTETALPLEALLSADAAFLTSSTRDVMPISAVDGTAMPFVPGPLTAAAAEAFAALKADHTDP